MTEPDLAGCFEVLTVPAVLIFHGGREVLRQARFLQIKEIEHILQQLPKELVDFDYNDLFN